MCRCVQQPHEGLTSVTFFETEKIATPLVALFFCKALMVMATTASVSMIRQRKRFSGLFAFCRHTLALTSTSIPLCSWIAGMCVCVCKMCYMPSACLENTTLNSLSGAYVCMFGAKSKTQYIQLHIVRPNRCVVRRTKWKFFSSAVRSSGWGV